MPSRVDEVKFRMERDLDGGSASSASPASWAEVMRRFRNDGRFEEVAEVLVSDAVAPLDAEPEAMSAVEFRLGEGKPVVEGVERGVRLKLRGRGRRRVG